MSRDNFLRFQTERRGGGKRVRLLLPLALLASLATGHAQLKLPGALPGTAKPGASMASVAPQPQSEPTATLAIPLPQIADQAEALDLQLEEISRGLAASQQETAPDAASAATAAEIAERAQQVDDFLHSGPDMGELREEIVYWRALGRASAAERKLLTERADELQDQIGQLGGQLARWQATQEQIHDAAGIEVVAARVQHELNAIRELRVQAQAQLNQLLTRQNELSETGRRISDALAKLTDAEARFRVSILDQDGQPLWSRPSPGEKAQATEWMLHRSSDQEFATAREFLKARGPALLLLPICGLLALLGAFRFRRYMDAAPAEFPAKLRELAAHPRAVALLGVLVLSALLTQSAPVSILTVCYVLWIALLFRLTPILLDGQLRPLVRMLLVFNLLEAVRAALPIAPGALRSLLPTFLLAALLCFGWLTRPSRMRRLPLSKWPRMAVQVGSRSGLLLLAAALLANVCGFLSLSRVLGGGTLVSALLAVALCFVVRVALLGLSVLLDGPWLGYLSGDLRGAVRLWGGRLMVLAAVAFWWTRSQLYVFLLQESVGGAVADALSFPIGLGKMQFTLGNVIVVLLILAVGFALARGFSSVVRSVLVARFPTQRGMPYAASKVAYYCLCVLVLLAAVTAAGVDLNKFTVITGAVGVGVGFGLQNIVNNFASGLILLFERPIRVEDTVEVNGLVGTVKRIGARSSTIATAQGAEVIVPNSNLVSNHVVNWTLSTPQRRIEIPVGVAYGTDPQRVIRLLADEAAKHANVMADPAPTAFFIGFGDSALNFELRFWSASQDIWFQLKSDVAVGVARALAEAGIEVPFPQRDLHLRSVDPSIGDPKLGGLADTIPSLPPRRSP